MIRSRCRRELATKVLVGVLVAGAGAWAPVFAQGADGIRVVVTKKAEASDPTIRVRAGRGSADVQDTLRRVLVYSGWFRIAEEGAGADYTIDPTLRTGTSAQLQLAVRARSGKGFLLDASGEESVDDLCRRAADRLIRELFGVPGPCRSVIAFVNGDKHKEIALMYPDGGGKQLLTRNGGISTEPDWGGQPGRLVYALYRNHRSETVLCDIRAKRQRRLSRKTGLNGGAALSPDGGRLAVVESRGARVDLVVRNVTSNEWQAVTSDSAVEASPAWSPDGRWLCFVSDRDGIPRVYRASMERGTKQPVIRRTLETVSPDWSPDGKRIVFAMRHEGRYRLAYTDVTKGDGEPVIVTDAGSDWESPSWAPDSRHVVCTRTRGGRRSICVVDTRDGSVQPITRFGQYALPDWSAPLSLR